MASGSFRILDGTRYAGSESFFLVSNKSLAGFMRLPWKKGRKSETTHGGMDPLSDAMLMERHLAGDVEAFPILFDRHAPRVHAFIRRQIADPAVAEELVQEVFLRLVRKGGTFQGRSKLSTWLFQIARNLVVDAYRRASHRKHPSLDQPIRGEEGARLGDTFAHSGPTPDRQVMDGQFTEALQEGLDALPDEQRAVFLLREVHGVRFQEIAEMLDVGVPTVKSRMRYALQALREHLKDMAPE